MNESASVNSCTENNQRATSEELSGAITHARIGERHQVKTKLFEKEAKTLDTKTFSAEELKHIHEQDPFMYYSIRGMWSAKVLMKDDDTTNLEASDLDNHTSCLSRPHPIQDQAQPQTVTRSSCISFECHPDLLIRDLFE